MTRSTRLSRLIHAGLACAAVAVSGCPGCPSSSVNPTMIPLEVGFYSSLPFTTADAGAAATKASGFLQMADYPGDVACPVALTVQQVYPVETGNGVISSQFDFDALFVGTPATGTAGLGAPPKTRQVRIVDGIYWCGGLIASAAGCGDQSGLRVAASLRPSMNAEIWAHEVGHTRGLIHRDNEFVVMNTQIVPGTWALNWLECQLYK